MKLSALIARPYYQDLTWVFALRNAIQICPSSVEWLKGVSRDGLLGQENVWQLWPPRSLLLKLEAL